MVDTLATLVLESESSFSVLGLGADFLLIDNSAPPDAGDARVAEFYGYEFCGVLGLKAGVPRVYCEPYPDCALTMTHAALAFCRLVADKIAPIALLEAGDAVPFLEGLYALQDQRP